MNLESDPNIRGARRHIRLIESALLDSLDGAERLLDLLEQTRAETQEFQKKWSSDTRLDKILADPEVNAIGKAQARRAKRQSATRLRKSATLLRQNEQQVRDANRLLRQRMQNYLATQAELEDAIHDREEAEAEYEAVERKNNSLLSKLGMALFAWNTVNAFDNLDTMAKDMAKLSGRKK